jgi:hypothetical protein
MATAIGGVKPNSQKATSLSLANDSSSITLMIKRHSAIETSLD